MSSNHNHITIQHIYSLFDSSFKIQYFAFYNYITRCNLTDIFVCKFKPNYIYSLITYLYVYTLITNYNYTRLSYDNMRKLSKFYLPSYSSVVLFVKKINGNNISSKIARA